MYMGPKHTYQIMYVFVYMYVRVGLYITSFRTLPIFELAHEPKVSHA
jgi:hypothetical protein